MSFDVSYGQDNQEVTFSCASSPVMCHGEDGLGQVKFVGMLDGFPFGWYLTSTEVVRVVVGCKNYTLAKALEYWAEKPDRAEIYSACEWLRTIAERRGWALGMTGKIIVNIAELEAIVDECQKDNLDAYAEQLQAVINFADMYEEPKKEPPVPRRAIGKHG